MKRLFILTSVIILAAAFSFCSDEYSNNNVSTITFKLDGVQKTFTSVAVKQDINSEEQHAWQEITASVNKKNSGNEMVYFEVENGYTGSDSLDGFFYSTDNTAYSMGWDAFTSAATVNNATQLEGTFSGTVKRFNTNTQQNENHVITNGSFTIVK